MRRVQRWSYSINSHPDWMSGEVHFESLPLWLLLVEYMGVLLAPSFLQCVKLPDWPKGFIKDDYFGDCSPRDWYGTLFDLVWASVTAPILQWVDEHPKREEISIPLGYEKVKEHFYADDPEFFDSADEFHA